MTYTLHPYQERIVQAPFDAWAGHERPTGTGAIQNALISAATGAGKTVVAAEVIARHTAKMPGRVVFVVNRDELAGQAFRTFMRHTPNRSVGIVKAADNDYHRETVIASIQTLAREKRRAPIRGVTLGIVDEAHHAVLGGTYEAVMNWFGHIPWLGITATPERADGKALGDLWQEIVARWSIMDGIRGGYLTDVRGRRIRIKGLDLRGVKRQGGDLQATDLGEHLHDASAAEQVLDAYVKYGEGRAGAFFWPTVATAEEFAAECARRNVPCDVVTGTTPVRLRAQMYERSRLAATKGTPHILSNCMVLTEGFDAPWLGVIGMVRMTESSALYTQIVGRGVRTWVNPETHEAKTDCLLLDYTGVGSRHRLAGFGDLLRSMPDDELEEREGESLTELEERAAAGAAALEPAAAIPGEIVAREFDPFAGSASSWLQTARGVPFLEVRNPAPGPGQARSFLLFLTPDPYGTYAIMTCPAVRGGRHSALTLETGMPFGAAQHHAEYLAGITDPTLASRKAPWRDARSPSAAQLAMFERATGWPMPAGITRGKASDLLSVEIANGALHG